MSDKQTTPHYTAAWWRLAWRTLWRDARAGELRLLVLAVALGVASLSSVSFLADRLNAGLLRDAGQLLGGDAVVVSDQPTPTAFIKQAKMLGLATVTTLSFPTMARGETSAEDSSVGKSRLIALKVVDEGYPLRGQLKFALSISSETTHANQGTKAPAPQDTETNASKQAHLNKIPQPGEVWVEASALDALGLEVGGHLWLGEKRLSVGGVLLQEPDRGAGFMNFAPRVMMHRADLDATGLVQPASRITWRFAVVGEPEIVERFVTWAQEHVKLPQVRGVRVESLSTGRPEMRQTLDRAGKFLNLVALLAALLSAVAVALAARSFASKHLDDCAMLRVLGLSQKQIAMSYCGEFVCVGLFASVIGLLLGYCVHFVFVQLLAGLVETALPPATWWPVVYGLATGLTLLLAFGLPPVLQLASVPALRVIRREVGEPKAVTWIVSAVGLLGFAVLLVVASRDLMLGLMVVGGFAGAALVFAGMAWLAVKLLRRSVTEGQSPTWLMLATRQISARPAYAMVQVSALAVGLLALALLVLLRTDLISSWRNATPATAPNRFVINIQPAQSQAFLDTLKNAGVQKFDWYPMVRGRLVAVNSQGVSAQDYSEERAKRFVDREFNLTFSDTLPDHNPIISGEWQPEEPNAMSVDELLAKTLGLKLGDVLRFDMAGVLYESRITSIRHVDWTSMRINFFVIFPRSQMDDVPTTYIAAFRAPETQGFDNSLVKQFPNVTNVDMGAALQQVQGVLEQVVGAVEFLFLFTLATGLVVLFAAVTATREERAREYAVLRALGASNRLLAQVQRAELAGVGALAGFLATSVAVAMGWGLARYAFEFSWNPSPWVPLLGAVVGALLALAAGWWGLREVLNRPVVQTLRQAQSV
ncbi:MAG: FtsX-like permease family protein [Betaproteobacteria bacterium]|nr:FtsX-like permease family protein [Betaproteobacteria bacterium]